MQGRMKAAWLKGLRKFEIVEVDIPQIQRDQVLVKILKVGICGSDRGMWAGHHFFNDLYTWDRFTPGEHGHEASGIVVEAGRDVKGVKEGDLVCRLNLVGSHDLEIKCFADYAVADAPIAVNGADPETICFADPVAVALNHIHHAHVSSGDTVLVIGQGFIGLLVTQLLRDRHVNVIATDIKDRRLALAGKFGARAIDARKPECEQRIAALSGDTRAVIECSGSDHVMEMACRLLGRGGTLVMMGAYRQKVTLSYTQLRIKGATVEFPMNGVKCKDNWAPAAEILQRDEVEVKSLIDHRDKLENLQKILENYEDEWLRVVLEP
jgi:L-iditol 2-dehydrogenase